MTESERQEVWEGRAMKICGLGSLALIIVLAAVGTRSSSSDNLTLVRAVATFV